MDPPHASGSGSNSNFGAIPPSIASGSGTGTSVTVERSLHDGLEPDDPRYDCQHGKSASANLPVYSAGLTVAPTLVSFCLRYSRRRWPGMQWSRSARITKTHTASSLASNWSNKSKHSSWRKPLFKGHGNSFLSHTTTALSNLYSTPSLQQWNPSYGIARTKTTAQLASKFQRFC